MSSPLVLPFLGYAGAVIEIMAVFSVPFLFWFAPDRTCFLINLLIFVPYALLIGVINQAIALKFSYDQYNHRHILLYTPLYCVLRMINVCARFTCLIKFLMGYRGCGARQTLRSGSLRKHEGDIVVFNCAGIIFFAPLGGRVSVSSSDAYAEKNHSLLIPSGGQPKA